MSEDYREVTPPLTAQMLEPLPEDCLGILFDQPLADEEYRALAALLERHPAKELYALQLASAPNPISGLGFLRHFPNLQRFACNLHPLQSFDGIQSLNHIDKLTIFRPDIELSAAPLGELTTLRELWLDGHYCDLSVLANLTGVTYMKMGYAGKLTDLSFLPPSVTTLSMNLGSITNIDALAVLPNLTCVRTHAAVCDGKFWREMDDRWSLDRPSSHRSTPGGLSESICAAALLACRVRMGGATAGGCAASSAPVGRVRSGERSGKRRARSGRHVPPWSAV